MDHMITPYKSANSTLLASHFPMLRSRSELLTIIADTPPLQSLYQEWTSQQQQAFLDFCTGARGVKLLYDSFFKEIINPETTPERLEEFLSLLLGT